MAVCLALREWETGKHPKNDCVVCGEWKAQCASVVMLWERQRQLGSIRMHSTRNALPTKFKSIAIALHVAVLADSLIPKSIQFEFQAHHSADHQKQRHKSILHLASPVRLDHSLVAFIHFCSFWFCKSCGLPQRKQNRNSGLRTCRF